MKRIQRQRTKGWRMPEGAIYVGRPSKWGNQFRVGDVWLGAQMTQRETVLRYRHWLEMKGLELLAFTEPLVGHDLVCWCALDEPCHADVLLDVAANG